MSCVQQLSEPLECHWDEVPALDANTMGVYEVGPQYILPHIPLSSDELKRFQNMTHAGRRHEFVRGRAMLRMIIARELLCEPNQVKIEVDGRGRLILPDFPEYAVSLSHFKGRMAVGFGPMSHLGIDVLEIPFALNESLARRMMSSKEYASWLLLGADRFVRLYHFFAIKEALIKAVGGTVWQMKQYHLYLDSDQIMMDWPLDTGFDGGAYMGLTHRTVLALAVSDCSRLIQRVVLTSPD